jgi:hypothetical protein
MYTRALAPYVERFGRDRLLLVDFNRLTSPSDASWQAILAFLGLAPVLRPGEAHNVTASKERYSPLMRKVYDLGLAPLEKQVPRPIRKLLRPLALRGGKDYDALLASAKAPLPPELSERLDADYAELCAKLGPLI